MADANQQNVSKFNTTVRTLITRLEKKSRREDEIANLNRLNKRIGLAKQSIGHDVLIKGAAPVFVEFAEKILVEDAAARDEFFLALNVRDEYIRRKGAIEKDDEFIFSLIDSIRTHYQRAPIEEREAVYADVKVLLACSLRYKITQTN
jgi:hypothetical protein